MPPERYVFVYGTLRRGELRDINHLQPRPEWVGQGRVSGVLYDLGAYPGIVLGGSSRVRGEVYRIGPELEQELDRIEEVWPQQTGEYAKREAQVLLDPPPQPTPASGSEPHLMRCLVYEIASDRAQGKFVVASGDWVQHRLAGV